MTEESNGKYSVMGGSTLTALWMKNLMMDNQIDYGTDCVPEKGVRAPYAICQIQANTDTARNFYSPFEMCFLEYNRAK